MSEPSDMLLFLGSLRILHWLAAMEDDDALADLATDSAEVKHIKKHCRYLDDYATALYQYMKDSGPSGTCLCCVLRACALARQI